MYKSNIESGLDNTVAGDARFPQLFSSLKIGRLTISNRFVVPALTTNFAEEDGTVGERLIAYLQARARGGFGLVITENLGVHPSGRVMPRMAMASEDRFIPGLRSLAKAVKSEGGTIFAQLSHAGRQTKSSITGMPLVAPSALPCPLNREMPEALSKDGIYELEQAFVSSAERVAEAGFDGVEIHAAHGYLVGGFLSRYSNKRTDHYGGSLKNRMRFLLNIVSGIKASLGDDFPISVRISASEFVDDGLNLPESTEIASYLREVGVHVLSVSVGVYESFNKVSMITGEPEGQWLDLTEALRRAAAPMPVIGVGRIKRPETAESALTRGQLDLAAFGRASMADPDLPRKVLEGREGDIRWCIGCNVCLGRSSRPESICPINIELGRESYFSVKPAGSSRYVRIVGSSLSALTAAWVAARRGYIVSIDPADGAKGGMQSWRARVPGKVEYQEAVDSLIQRAVKSGVTFDGAEPPRGSVICRVRQFQPAEDGWNDKHSNIVSPYEILSGERSYDRGSRILLVGADLALAEAALKLAQSSCQVRLYSPANDIATDAHPGYREVSRRLLQQFGAELYFQMKEIDVDSLHWGDVLVVGYSQGSDSTRTDGWKVSPKVASAYADRGCDAWIDDAYEPGLMTKGIYDAAELMVRLDP